MGERCRREKLRKTQFFFGLPVYFKLMILFYTFTKALCQRFDIFSSQRPRFIFLQKSLLPLKKNSFLSDQWKEIEKINRMGKTRDLFKKISDIKGIFHAKMDTKKDRHGMNLTEAEHIKRWQEYTEKLYKKRSS